MLLSLLILINLVGALGPELAFDALWYHLTLPKLYLSGHGINFIPGGLFYYSAMPKLGEMFYVVALTIGNEIMAKLIHFSFGLLTLIAIYSIAKKYFSLQVSLIVTLIFYSNLVVSWLSITAYIDLIRTFFEIMAFWAFLNWHDTKKNKWLLGLSLMLGFAIATKILALGSIGIYFVLIFYVFTHEKFLNKFDAKYSVLIFSLVFIIPLPWLVTSFLATGNPVYPFFTPLYHVPVSSQLINPINIIKDVFVIFTQSADPISPIYLAIAPVLLIMRKKISKIGKIFVIYSFVSIIVWYLTPRSGGGRFITAYLPVLSILIGEILAILKKQKLYLLHNLVVILVIFLTLVTIGVRGYANKKYIPVLLGEQSKNDFLTKNLNFLYGDFYDTDDFFKKNITAKDKVLLIGFHNLYYVDFPFIDNSYLKEGDTFNYIAVQNGELPREYNNWHIIYENKITHVKLYKSGRYISKI